ncbi:MAG: zinc-ribbon domain-containing protein [Streptosporangiales bacterium]|nr:zinc-ribbon domain-containing protein [Streptosporangiales bacterium]
MKRSNPTRRRGAAHRGFKTILKVLSEGVFNCPQCGGDRQYKLCLARRWFTFFGIPIFTYKTVGRLVECTGCGSHWEEGVLQRPTTAARQAAATAVAEAGLHGYTEAGVDQDLGAPPVDPSGVLVPLGGSSNRRGASGCSPVRPPSPRPRARSRRTPEPFWSTPAASCR